jgi:hypothetical protein
MSLEHLNTELKDLSNKDLVALATETESRVETCATSLIAMARQVEGGVKGKTFRGPRRAPGGDDP